MATLIVTYSRIDASRNYVAPVAQGSGIRTEIITIPNTGALTATGSEEIVELLADADCWVAIGPAPDTATATARKLKADIPYQFKVSAGDKVKVAAVA